MSAFVGQNQYDGMTTKERFWQKVGVGDPDECWNWIGGQCDGYGVLRVGDTALRAHRISWQIKNKRNPPNCILHTCDNRLCVNPAHLYSGTKLDNALDREERGRGALPGPSGLRGVHWHKASGKWQGQIKFQGKKYYLGIHDNKWVLAKRYNEKAIELFGDKARLNALVPRGWA